MPERRKSDDHTCASGVLCHFRTMGFLFKYFTAALFLVGISHGASIEGRVQKIIDQERSIIVKVHKSADAELVPGSEASFSIGPGDASINYTGRLIQAQVSQYAGQSHLECIFPLEGPGDRAMADANRRLRKETATMQRRNFVREGDYIPEFGMINQHGKFLQIRELRGKAFVLNFIFTRCRLPEMCPASTARMAELQELAGNEGLSDLHFVSITFDPEFDSPGILRQYADGYGIDSESFHFLTNSDPQVAEDLLRRFGIMTFDEDGTINHTMATFLIDKNGRVAYRKEGSVWSVPLFLEKAKELN